MKRSRSASALIAAATLFGAAGSAFAANPTQADFDACNREAQLSVQNPAASPRGGGATATPGPRTSGGPSSRDTTVSGSAGASAPGSTGTGVGGTMSSHSTTSGSTTPGSTTSATTTQGSTVSGSGSTSTDSTLLGMAA